eukprot:CAMPEP_0174695724 /NCGR_PEP_ID=MMETSP1094-20130205/2042_1 /TAXON_ID=156173 /ORGANISM="Chrysochromulina brevifilum, Strain UTEX LB 985" /LENGTH=112 /DNA_ID=CAMNT_0015892297 /DNA_START=294 /DNA_END=628 /DNA_ORIENTATION=+
MAWAVVRCKIGCGVSSLACNVKERYQKKLLTRLPGCHLPASESLGHKLLRSLKRSVLRLRSAKHVAAAARRVQQAALAPGACLLSGATYGVVTIDVRRAAALGRGGAEGGAG